MPSVPRLTDKEIKEREDRKRKYRQEYNSRPEVKLYQKEWHRKDNQDPLSKENHRQAQERYRHTEKGRACNDRYWKKHNSKSRQSKQDKGNDNGISLVIDRS